MSSTSKTEHYRLNSWIGTDIPKMEDFNYDNQMIDSAMYSHQSDNTLHISEAERSVWNTPYQITTYYGNGSSSRVINLTSDFTPSWGIVFAAGKLTDVTDFNNKSDYNYFGMVAQKGSMNGLTLSAKKLTVTQSATAVFDSEYKNFNENGVTYICIMFR